MSRRIDRSSRLIRAAASAVYRAFAEPGALERWLPPADMTGEMLGFDFRSGGEYRMRLRLRDPAAGRGKTTPDADEVRVRLVRVDPGRCIVQEVDFDSDDPAFGGTMTMIWTLKPVEGGTRVEVRAENVPRGIRPEDHRAGLDSSLSNLARFVEDR